MMFSLPQCSESILHEAFGEAIGFLLDAANQDRSIFYAVACFIIAPAVSFSCGCSAGCYSFLQ